MPIHPTSAKDVSGCAGVRWFRRRAARPRPRGAPCPGAARLPGPRSSCSTATRAPPPRGTRSPCSCTRPATPWSAPTCAATAGPSKPTTTDDHAPYSKRAMAADPRSPSCAASGTSASPWSGTTGAATSRSGSPSTIRPGRPRSPCSTAYPTAEALARCHPTGSPPRWWHWFFFAQPDKPERAITRRSRRLVRRTRPGHGRAGVRGVPPRPSTIRRPCARCSRTTGPASASTAPHDEADRAAGRRVAARRWSCGPATTTSSTSTATRSRVWADWAPHLRGGPSIRPPHGRGSARRGRGGTARVSRVRAGWPQLTVPVAASSTRSSAAVMASCTTPRSPPSR